MPKKIYLEIAIYDDKSNICRFRNNNMWRQSNICRFSLDILFIALIGCIHINA